VLAQAADQIFLWRDRPNRVSRKLLESGKAIIPNFL
jgi:hypothetical protein